MGSDTGKEVNQVCFILVKETETQKTSLQVPLINTARPPLILPQIRHSVLVLDIPLTSNRILCISRFAGISC